MKLFCSVVVCLIFSLPVNAAKNVNNSSVNYVYQQDTSPTDFEFQSNVAHSCGSSLYRVKSNDTEVANRKFSIVLTAFTTGKNLAFHDSEVCEGNRSIVSWVRITN